MKKPKIMRCLICKVRMHGWKSYFRIYPTKTVFTICPRCRRQHAIEEIYLRLIAEAIVDE